MLLVEEEKQLVADNPAAGSAAKGHLQLGTRVTGDLAKVAFEGDLQAHGYPVLWVQYLPADSDLLEWAFGEDLRAENPDYALLFRNEDLLKLPRGRPPG